MGAKCPASRATSLQATRQENGFVKSLGRPGGNATGVTIMNPTITGTLLELLKEIAPRTMATRYVV